MDLFQLEMIAKQVYPERFGAWPSHENGDTYSAFDESERSFDHGRVADVVNEDL